MEAGTDVTEARMLSYNDNYIQIYSNSWGPADTGFIVGGPGELASKNFKQQTAEVRIENPTLPLDYERVSPS